MFSVFRHFSRPVARYVMPDQAQRPPDDRVGSSGNKADIVLDVQLFGKRAIDYKKHVPSTRAAELFQVIKRFPHSLNGCDQDRHMLGAASGHHPVHRNIPWCHPYG